MSRMPTLFVSHGAPTFALEPGRAGAQLVALGRALDQPSAVVIVSPHWMTRGVEITSGAQLATIHDFGGFPELHPKTSSKVPSRSESCLMTRA